MILRHMIDIDETLKLTQSQGQGSRSIPEGKHFWKYKNVHLYQTGATDIFTRRKCPCFLTKQLFQREITLLNLFLKSMFKRNKCQFKLLTLKELQNDDKCKKKPRGLS